MGRTSGPPTGSPQHCRHRRQWRADYSVPIWLLEYSQQSARPATLPVLYSGRMRWVHAGLPPRHPRADHDVQLRARRAEPARLVPAARGPVSALSPVRQRATNRHCAALGSVLAPPAQLNRTWTVAPRMPQRALVLEHLHYTQPKGLSKRCGSWRIRRWGDDVLSEGLLGTHVVVLRGRFILLELAPQSRELLLMHSAYHCPPMIGMDSLPFPSGDEDGTTFIGQVPPQLYPAQHVPPPPGPPCSASYANGALCAACHPHRRGTSTESTATGCTVCPHAAAKASSQPPRKS